MPARRDLEVRFRAACHWLLPSLRVCYPALSERIGVDQTALAPEPVHTSLQTEAVRPEMALVDFTEVAGSADRLQSPVVVDPEHLAEVAFDPQNTTHFRVVGFLGELVGIGLSDPEFLRGNQRVAHPRHDIGPLLVALTGQ